MKDFSIRLIIFFLKVAFILFWGLLVLGFLKYRGYLDYFKNDNSISIYTWCSKIDESIVNEFQKKTGIKVYMKYYECDEELIIKMELAKDFYADIFLCSSNAICMLKNIGVLRKLDFIDSKKYMKNIFPEFLNNPCDLNNEYSLPVYWDIIGLGYSKKFFKDKPLEPTWKVIFDKNFLRCKKLGMIDDPRIVLFILERYLNINGKLSKLDLQKMLAICVQQKKWVGSYNDYQQGYFLRSETYPLVVSDRDQILRENLKNSDFDFIVPKEGTLLITDNLAISCKTKKEKLIKRFIDFLLDENNLSINCKKFLFLPCNKVAYSNLSAENLNFYNVLPHDFKKRNISIYKHILDPKIVHNFWINVKAA